MNLRVVMSLLTVVVGVTSALAQTSIPLQPELSNAAFLIGKWEGAGWIEWNQPETI